MRSQKALGRGFTLIELLLVIAVIGILMALIVPAFERVPEGGKLALARAELGEMESAIQDYKEKIGFYPPDNPANPAMAPLYFELLGTTNNGNNYVTLDASGQILVADINADFGRQGFANSSTKAHSTDETGAPMSFLNHLQKNQIGQIDASKPLIKILVCSVEWPAGSVSAPIAGSPLNPWHYVSSHPTNNPGAYDLWVDLSIGGKIHRVNNWGVKP